VSDPDLISDPETRLLWFFLVFAIPGVIALAFWLNGYLG
jgi:hypothetical protein